MDLKYAVITGSGSKYLISEATNQKLMQASLDDLVQLDNGVKIKVSASMEIVPLDVFYQQFPKEKPAPVFEDQFKKYERLALTAGDIVNRAPHNGLVQMLKGLKRFIDTEHTKTGVIPHKAIALYEEMEKKLKMKQNANPQAEPHS
jgi:hypothetical protein